MNREEYIAEVIALSEEINQSGQDPYDMAYEMIDGHEWIIYPRYHSDIIAHSEHYDDYLDVYSTSDLGDIIKVKGLDHIIMIRAFYAMLGDLHQELNSIQ